ncbi:hypothetical protein CABS01_13915 [Colletotrichum abscissum]|uniref:Uncharacterized protein n=1 Tax=Colletotrichum abscissum TaxID=1671311 RepID=A0A9P9XCH6_9PEZI|nr:uncharacterized protein CABS01_13915 [Colletotrichum abscissum]KAI3547961.1 hypothetical protein CABS02_08429 [Colletotrichum abscissum]KAK1483763.1 hypothetical protein CABS01_13915 [Colletotrichum abscissum]
MTPTYPGSHGPNCSEACSPTAQQNRKNTKANPSATRAFASKDLKELKGFCPERLVLQWGLPRSSLTDDFFTRHYAAIISNINLHAKQIFEVGDVPPPGPVWSVVTGDQSSELERTIEKVARPDPRDKSPWDDLIACDYKRILVMRAFFLKLFEEQIFSLQLFGADNQQRLSLLHQDKQFMKHEGFRRSELRAKTVNMLLEENHGLPPLFWKQVDHYTMKTFLLIRPILTWVRMTWPENGPNPSIRSIFQMIHHDVAYAAWLSVNIRLSPEVLHFEWREPDELYVPGDFEIPDPGVLPRPSNALLSPTSTGFIVSTSRFREPPIEPPLSRVLISFVPVVQRVSLVEGASGEEPIGSQRRRLLESRTAYYTLWRHTDEVGSSPRSLVDHACEMRRPRPTYFSAIIRPLFWQLLIYILLIQLLRYVYQLRDEYSRRNHEGGADSAYDPSSGRAGTYEGV